MTSGFSKVGVQNVLKGLLKQTIYKTTYEKFNNFLDKVAMHRIMRS